MKRLHLIFAVLLTTFSSTYLFGQCEDYFQAGSSMLYKPMQSLVRNSDFVYIDTTFSCDEGVCFYGIFRSGRSKPDVIDGFYNGNEFYYGRLIRKTSGNGWKEVIHYNGSCDEYNAMGEYFGERGEYQGRFLLLK